jgi:hypothetical protein
MSRADRNPWIAKMPSSLLYLKNNKRLTKDPQYVSRHWATYICVAKTLKMNTLVGFPLSILNSICGVMDNVLASSAVDCGFEPWSGQPKDHKINICCFSAKHESLR